MEFKIIITKSNGMFLAESVELDVMSQGETPKDALSMVKDAIRGLMDNNDVILTAKLFDDSNGVISSKHPGLRRFWEDRRGIKRGELK